MQVNFKILQKKMSFPGTRLAFPLHLMKSLGQNFSIVIRLSRVGILGMCSWKQRYSRQCSYRYCGRPYYYC